MPVPASGGVPGGGVHVAPPVPVAAHAGAPPPSEQNEAQLLAPLVVMHVEPGTQSFADAQTAPGLARPAGAQVAPVGTT
jgi:hypothetical protein